MSEIDITTSLNLKELSVQLRHQVDNKDLSKFAVSLGEDGDWRSLSDMAISLADTLLEKLAKN